MASVCPPRVPKPGARAIFLLLMDKIHPQVYKCLFADLPHFFWGWSEVFGMLAAPEKQLGM